MDSIGRYLDVLSYIRALVMFSVLVGDCGGSCCLAAVCVGCLGREEGYIEWC